MIDIINRFITKSYADKKSVYFLYGGNVINEKSLLSDIIKREDINRNQMNFILMVKIC